MLAGLALSLANEWSPDTSEEKQGSRFVQREPICDFGLAVGPFAKARDRNKAAEASACTMDATSR